LAPAQDTKKEKAIKMPNDMLIADFVVATVQERDFELDRALATAKFRASMGRKLGIVVTQT
jgi:hypothetical protein